jgi:hypothetical protein
LGPTQIDVHHLAKPVRAEFLVVVQNDTRSIHEGIDLGKFLCKLLGSAFIGHIKPAEFDICREILLAIEPQRHNLKAVLAQTLRDREPKACSPGSNDCHPPHMRCH